MPGSARSEVVTKRFPVPTSTDMDTVSEMENGIRVAEGRDPVKVEVSTAAASAGTGRATRTGPEISNITAATRLTGRRKRVLRIIKKSPRLRFMIFHDLHIRLMPCRHAK
ncbi:hypothetical protein GCM10017774_41760 [Lentzea cavernae]|uniref:Uncharacterized protein n=1 Tax=Lentzea cavernae TaxID=2020703 RepID=A0ABQ3MJ23_9PSEU|nr:hypothetical protein GCM10017774_41760 [Lentzea cavernae]